VQLKQTDLHTTERQYKMKTLNKIILAAFVPLMAAPIIGMTADNSANWKDPSQTTWKSSTGECWRSSSWTPAMATAECDPSLIKKAEVAPAPVIVAAAPAPAPVAAPAPVYVAPPVRTAVRNVSFSAEDLFAFNKSELKPEGKNKLNNLVEDMKITDNESIVATGHADRIGNKKYNQKLSERRADTVRDYLIAKGILASQIRAEGMGETQPVTMAGDCKGPVSKKLITCLQPDRRVDVEVTATKVVTLSVN
jgi:OOP family OmpA-OmpF porin